MGVGLVLQGLLGDPKTPPAFIGQSLFLSILHRCGLQLNFRHAEEKQKQELILNVW